MIPEINQPAAGRRRITGSPIKFSETPGMAGEPAPVPGQHTSDDLKQMLGLDESAVESLLGIVFQTESCAGAA